MQHRIRRHQCHPIENELDTVREAPVFQTLPLSSGIERLAALYALRMIEGARLQSKLYAQRVRHHDFDVLNLTGLALKDHRPDGMTLAQLRQALENQHRRLSARGMPTLRAVESNIARLGAALRLTPAECRILQLALVVQSMPDFNEILRFHNRTPEQFFNLVRHATEEKLAAVSAALSPAGTLRRAGLLGDFELSDHSHPLEIDSSLATELMQPGFDIERMLRRLLRTPPPASLALADFAHLPEAELISRYLARALRKQADRGVNILIHGVPGTGKTEFVRALAAHLGVRLGEVPVEGEKREPVSGPERFRAFSLAQALLAREPGQLLLFDEVEDVFGNGFSSFLRELFGRGRNAPTTKGWINETLETNPVPTLWVCNDITAMDPAYLRRFDLVAEFRAPTERVRRRIVQRCFPEGTLSRDGIQALTAMESLPPAQIARAARVVKTLGARKIDERDAQARRVLDMSLRAMGVSTTKKTAALPAHYDPALLNTDRNLAALIDGLRAGHPARLCLYGPPGTGKSALGAYLAQRLDRPLHVKRASDLISMWLGETEKNIARAFLAAGDEGAILLIDEADSFLQDRRGAQRSWEVTQVNEMLTRMEAFEGLFIASTNLVESLDAASLRRFDFKIRFDYLDRQQRVALFQRVLGDAPIDEHTRQRIERLDRLTPGDMANALRQMRVTGETPFAAGLLALIETELRLKPGGGRAEMGFVR